MKAIERQLKTFRIFITEIQDIRKRERLEAALIFNMYVIKEPYADLIDRGMSLKPVNSGEEIRGNLIPLF